MKNELIENLESGNKKGWRKVFLRDLGEDYQCSKNVVSFHRNGYSAVYHVDWDDLESRLNDGLHRLNLIHDKADYQNFLEDLLSFYYVFSQG